LKAFARVSRAKAISPDSHCSLAAISHSTSAYTTKKLVSSSIRVAPQHFRLHTQAVCFKQICQQ